MNYTKLFDSNRSMNRALRNSHVKRCAFRKSGGGLSQSVPLLPIPQDDWTFAVKQLENQRYDDCVFPERHGQLVNTANPALAQTPMAGGRRSRSRSRKHGGGCGCSTAWLKGGRRTRRQQRGGMGCMMRGGASNGFQILPTINVGGSGPNTGALVAPIPCSVRYQHGGREGSSLPVYNAPSAGFHFRPSTESGASLPDGVTAFNEVVPHVARVGGRRRTYKKRGHRKH